MLARMMGLAHNSRPERRVAGEVDFTEELRHTRGQRPSCCKPKPGKRRIGLARILSIRGAAGSTDGMKQPGQISLLGIDLEHILGNKHGVLGNLPGMVPEFRELVLPAIAG